MAAQGQREEHIDPEEKQNKTKHNTTTTTTTNKTTTTKKNSGLWGHWNQTMEEDITICINCQTMMPLGLSLQCVICIHSIYNMTIKKKKRYLHWLFLNKWQYFGVLSFFLWKFSSAHIASVRSQKGKHK